MQASLLIAAALREIGRLLLVKGENQFRARAYERAAQALERLGGDLDVLIRERRLTQISGIGDGLAAAIEELCRTGRSALLDDLRRELPAGVLDLSQVPGLSLKKIIALHAALGVESLAELQEACEQGRVRRVKGFGDKTEAKILEAIERFGKRDERVLLPRAVEECERLLGYLRNAPEVLAADEAGSLRRRKETVASIKLVAASEAPAAVMEHLTRFPAVARVVMQTDKHCGVALATGVRVELIVAPPKEYATALHSFTGSKKHYSKLQELAQYRGSALGPEGFRTGGGETLLPETEEEIYRRLGMQYVPPELREDEGEIEAALAGTLPALVSEDDIQGMVHCHTVYSDGKNTVEEMALAAEGMGMMYLTITDHSPSAFYARGVKLDRLKLQWEEIARVQEKVKVRLLRGTESDILEDGSLDYPDSVLERFDIIIASIHHRAKMDADQMTRRIVRAMQWPVFKIWGHPLGRLIQSRPPLECRMENVLDAVAESGAAIEVNGDPRRLDLEPRWIRAARQRGIKFVVSTDAHSTQGLRNLRYGIAMARRGWLTRDEVLNTSGAEDFRNMVHP
jgi:DNA polymerase (family 10)